MKRIIYATIGGTLVMFAFSLGFLIGEREFFQWTMAWPAVAFYRFFSSPAAKHVFPELGRTSGILCTFAFATLTYSLLIYIVLLLLPKTSRLTRTRPNRLDASHGSGFRMRSR